MRLALTMMNRNIIDEIWNFESLVSLEIAVWNATADQIKKLAEHLPHLTKLNIRINEDEPNAEDFIRSMLSVFPKLIKLTIMLNLRQFFEYMKDPIDGLRKRFDWNRVIACSAFTKSVHIKRPFISYTKAKETYSCCVR